MDAYRAEIIYCINDPSKFGESAICHFEDGLLVVNSSGEIEACGEAKTLLKEWEGNCSYNCLLYTSPSPRDLSTSRMPSSA